MGQRKSTEGVFGARRAVFREQAGGFLQLYATNPRRELSYL